jgi:hypothetical protein
VAWRRVRAERANEERVRLSRDANFRLRYLNTQLYFI